MSTTPHESSPAAPQVPLTIEGSAVLHQMLRVNWLAWRACPAPERAAILEATSRTLAAWEGDSTHPTALYSLLGHKGDLMLVHFRQSFEHLASVEWALARLPLWPFLEVTTSYVSVVELGLYESSGKTYAGLAGRGVAPFTKEWDDAIEETLSRQRSAMSPRLYPEIPPSKYICFYPMDRKRGENKNWYTVPMAERARMMHEHGMVGRRYAGVVRQIISGSIGMDDWEWGVDLFAEDPVVFKKLIYEMRFDEVSAVYALFGKFYLGVRLPAAELAEKLSL